MGAPGALQCTWGFHVTARNDAAVSLAEVEALPLCGARSSQGGEHQL